MSCWIGNFDKEGEIIEKIKLYPRTIFTVDEKGSKTITNAIIIDGALEHSKSIMEFLYNIKWNT